MTEHLGEQFARALAAKDAAALKGLLQPELDFKALTPGRFWESHDAGEVVDEMMLGTWFEPERRIVETLAVDTDSVGSMDRVGYRFRVSRPDGEFVIEQQAYFEARDGKIGWLRIMCSGFVPLGET